jgi:hypothetical protein
MMRSTKEIDEEIRAQQAEASQQTLAAWRAQTKEIANQIGANNIGTYQDVGDTLPFDTTNPYLSAAMTKIASLNEAVVAHPFVVLWYNSNPGRYERYWATSDEDAIEKARKTMELPSCTQLQIFEVAHRWEKEWLKR